jgi:CRP-like cAMP-binding protein
VRLRKDAKVELIAQAPLFAGCSRRELQAIATAADEVDVPEGKELTREGETGREFFVLVDGAAEVRRRGRKLRDLGPGDFFGEIALVARVPRSATVTTTTPVRALVVTQQAFEPVLRSGDVQQKVMQALVERLGDADF